jgi:hypothetical protein
MTVLVGSPPVCESITRTRFIPWTIVKDSTYPTTLHPVEKHFQDWSAELQIPRLPRISRRGWRRSEHHAVSLELTTGFADPRGMKRVGHQAGSTAGPSTALRSGRDDNSFCDAYIPHSQPLRGSFLPHLAAGNHHGCKARRADRTPLCHITDVGARRPASSKMFCCARSSPGASEP